MGSGDKSFCCTIIIALLRNLSVKGKFGFSLGIDRRAPGTLIDVVRLCGDGEGSVGCTHPLSGCHDLLSRHNPECS